MIASEHSKRLRHIIRHDHPARRPAHGRADIVTDPSMARAFHGSAQSDLIAVPISRTSICPMRPDAPITASLIISAPSRGYCAGVIAGVGEIGKASLRGGAVWPI
jgi:hypothetical protein